MGRGLAGVVSVSERAGFQENDSRFAPFFNSCGSSQSSVVNREGKSAFLTALSPISVVPLIPVVAFFYTRKLLLTGTVCSFGTFLEVNKKKRLSDTNL